MTASKRPNTTYRGEPSRAALPKITISRLPLTGRVAGWVLSIPGTSRDHFSMAHRIIAGANDRMTASGPAQVIGTAVLTERIMFGVKCGQFSISVEVWGSAFHQDPRTSDVVLEALRAAADEEAQLKTRTHRLGMRTHDVLVVQEA